MIRLGILGSTRGTNLQAVIDAIEAKQLDASINLVISNKKDAYILKRAEEQGLPFAYVPMDTFSREAYDLQLSDLLKAHAVDVVVLIGYMRILSKAFVNSWENKIINIHPSLLPAFAGKMDLAIHQAVLDAGLKETGATVHLVTEELDNGPIIIQKTCPVLAEDDPETLKQRVQKIEGEALVEALQNFAEQSP